MSFQLEQLSQLLQLPLQGPPGMLIERACPLEQPHPAGLAFCENQQQLKQLTGEPQQLGVLICSQAPGPDWRVLLSPHPRVSFAQALALLYPEPAWTPGIHPTAWVDPTAQVDPSARIGPFCQILAGARVGPKSHLLAQVHLGRDCSIGEECQLQPGSLLEQDSHLGNHCRLEPGCRLLQGTRIGDRVWLGARNVLTQCQLADGIKTDNLVAMAQGCQIQSQALVISQSCLGPSTRLGAYALVAAQAMTLGHLELAAGVQVAGRSLVAQSVLTPKLALAGEPAVAYPLEMKARACKARAYALWRASKAKAKGQSLAEGSPLR